MGITDVLPLLLADDLPTTGQAQAIKAWVNRGGDISTLAGATRFTKYGSPR